MHRLMSHGYMCKKTVLDSGFQAVNSRLQVPQDSGFLVNWTCRVSSGMFARKKKRGKLETQDLENRKNRKVGIKK